MLPISQNADTKQWQYPAYVENIIPDWGANFTDSELGFGSSTVGRTRVCQEVDGNTAGNRVLRGNEDASHAQPLPLQTQLTFMDGHQFSKS